MMIKGARLGLSLAIADQVTAESLERMRFLYEKHVDRRADSAGRVAYEVRPEPAGAYWGSIHLRAVADDVTAIEFREPERPPARELTPAELTAIDALPTTEAQDRATAALILQMRAETDALWRAMRQYFRDLVAAFMQALRDDDAVRLADASSCVLSPATGEEKTSTRRETRIIRGGSPAAVLIAAAGHDTRLTLMRRAEPQPKHTLGTRLQRGTPTDDENPAHAFMAPGGSVSVLRRGDGCVELVLGARAADWPQLQATWEAMLARLGERGFEVMSPNETAQPPAALPSSGAPQEEEEPPGGETSGGGELAEGIDATDKRIIALYPNMTAERVGERIGLARKTVQNRVTKLYDAGLLTPKRADHPSRTKGRKRGICGT